MIPEEVAVIADILLDYFEIPQEHAIAVAYKIYNELNICKCE